MRRKKEMDDALVMLFGLGAIALIITSIICLALYLIDAIGKYKYLKVRNYPNAWFAFIPFLNTYGTVEATYGNVENIKVLGIKLPAIVVKLYPVILAVIGGITAKIDPISSICSFVISVLTIALGVVIFKDIMERIECPVSTGFAILANIITIVGSIKLLADTGRLQPGQFDYMTDTRILASQAGSQGPQGPVDVQ